MADFPVIKLKNDGWAIKLEESDECHMFLIEKMGVMKENSKEEGSTWAKGSFNKKHEPCSIFLIYEIKVRADSKKTTLFCLKIGQYAVFDGTELFASDIVPNDLLWDGMSKFTLNIMDEWSRRC